MKHEAEQRIFFVLGRQEAKMTGAFEILALAISR
jgi:hypothetical protein